MLRLAQVDDVGTAVSLLRAHPVFSLFPDELWTPQFLGEHLLYRHRGENLYEIATPGDECYLICSGRVGLLSKDRWERLSLFAVKAKGAVVGDLSLFDDALRSSTSRALETSLILTIPYAIIRERMAQDLSLAQIILGAYAARIRASDDRIVEALNFNLISRLARRMLELAQGRTEFELSLTQEEIASLVGASRERTNKALATLQRCGALEIHGHHLYRVPDPAKLSVLALQRSHDRRNAKRLPDHSGPIRSDLVERS
ncbi:Crp/Fnr family transcriptional regulator [Ferrimicrobium sp.]|uniref:Crp/Fnr family transcriptional regulator n=1 Tax=Ferrimicrobium sp. TaxID=2926050 RepID=UPI0026308F28|nr:Crp/Fnr family transcriptional regulator [Ferrimicrobium sp.]